MKERNRYYYCFIIMIILFYYNAVEFNKDKLVDVR